MEESGRASAAEIRVFLRGSAYLLYVSTDNPCGRRRASLGEMAYLATNSIQALPSQTWRCFTAVEPIMKHELFARMQAIHQHLCDTRHLLLAFGRDPKP
jgi:hypothetical protein